jgi:hypothetical protein
MGETWPVLSTVLVKGAGIIATRPRISLRTVQLE